jgi:hypothetical protein
MAQLAAGAGFQADKPLDGCGSKILSSVLSALHFEFVQMATTKVPDGLLDEIVARHSVSGGRLTLFKFTPNSAPGESA